MARKRHAAQLGEQDQKKVRRAMLSTPQTGPLNARIASWPELETENLDNESKNKLKDLNPGGLELWSGELIGCLDVHHAQDDVSGKTMMSVQSDLRQVQNDLAALRRHYTKLETDLAGTTQESKSLKTRVGKLKKDVACAMQESKSLKTSVGKLEQESKSLETRVGKLETDLAAMQESKSLKTRVGKLETDLAAMIQRREPRPNA